MRTQMRTAQIMRTYGAGFGDLVHFSNNNETTSGERNTLCIPRYPFGVIRFDLDRLQLANPSLSCLVQPDRTSFICIRRTQAQQKGVGYLHQVNQDGLGSN